MASLQTSGFLLLSLLFAGATPARAQTPVAAISGGSVYLGIVDASGRFGDMKPFDSLPAINDGYGPRSLALDHFDRDGYLDLLVGTFTGEHFGIYKYPGLSGGDFGARERFAPLSSPRSSFNSSDWAHGDCNGDGIADLVQTSSSSAATAVMLSSPSGYQLSIRNLGSAQSEAIDLADMNADGHLDLIRSNWIDGQVALYLGDGAGGFAFLRDLGDAGENIYSVVAADFDNDGHLDVIAHAEVSGDFTLWRGDGTGNFRSGEVFSGPNGIDAHLDAFDYNQDGNVDLVVAAFYTSSDAFRLLPGRGNGNFGPAVQIPMPRLYGRLLDVEAPPLRHPRAPVARATPAEQALAPGDTAHFDGSASTTAPGSVLIRQTWVFEDGSEVEGAVLDHTNTVKGRYWPEFRVVADNGLEDAARALAVVTGAPPVADAGGPYVYTPAQARNGMWPVLLDGRATTNDGGEGARYRWNLMPDISFSDEFADTLDTARWINDHSTTEAGTLRLTAEGDDSAFLASRETFPRRHGLTYTTRMRINSVTTCEVSYTLGFKDPLSAPHSFSHALRLSVYYPFCQEGRSRILLSATETTDTYLSRTLGFGIWYEFKIELQTFGTRYWMRHSGAGEPWELLGTSTTVFNPAPDVKVAVATDPGIVNEIDYIRLGREAEGPVLTETFGGSGTFPVTLTVTDFLGQSDTASTTVTTSAGRPPTVVISGPDEFPRLLEAPFSASVTTDSHGILRYVWSFGDGSTPPSSDQVGHVFTQAGDHVIRLTVYDHAGLSATAERRIRITSRNAVRCVPWRIENGAPLPQETWSGKEITLKGVANTARYPLTYTWNFGDGSPPVSGAAATFAQASAIEGRHAYSGVAGRTFLATLSIVDNYGGRHADTCAVVLKDSTLAVENNVAIDQALWFLYKAQHRMDYLTDYGRSRWNTATGYNHPNVTASVLQAFAMNGHKAMGDPAQDPYAETVRAGINGLLDLFASQPIASQPRGNPDANGNGIGISSGAPERNEPLHAGPAMVALIAAGEPFLTSPRGHGYLPNRPFREIVQDMADMYAFGQQDSGRGRGGWGRRWNHPPLNSSDNFSSFWGAYGLLLAERHWGITVPDFVKAENRIWLDATYQGGDGICGFGFDAPWHSLELTPAGMVQLAWQRTARNSGRWSCTEARMDNLWTSFLVANSTYGYLAFAAAMRLAKVPVVNLSVSGRDWLEAETGGLRRTLVNRQRADGSWLGSGYLSDAVANTAWTALILSPPKF